MSPSSRAGKVKVLVRRHGSASLSPALRRAVQVLAQKKGVRLDLESPKEISADKDVENASEWNSLLINARAARGPQWDAATQMFHVDKDSHLYFDPSPLEQREEENPPAEPEVPPLGNPLLQQQHQQGQSHYHNIGNIPLSGPSGYYETPPPLSSPQNHRVPSHTPYHQPATPSNPYAQPPQPHAQAISPPMQSHHPQMQHHPHTSQHHSPANGYSVQSQFNPTSSQYFNGNVNLAQPASPVVNMGGINGMGMGPLLSNMGRMPPEWMYGNGM